MKRTSLLLLLLCFSANAHAAPQRKRVAILPSIVRGGSDAITATSIVETIGRSLEQRPALDPVTATELFTGTDESVVTTVERCGADIACISTRARQSGIQLALRAIINYAVVPAVVSLHLVDTDEATIVREAFGEAHGDPKAALLEMAGKLFDEAGYREGARIKVVLTPADAELTFDRPARRIGPDLFLVEEGLHHVEAKKPGFLPLAQDVTVESGKEASVALALLEDSEPITSSPWLWVGVAAGVAVVAGGVALAVINPFQTEKICITSQTGPGCP